MSVRTAAPQGLVQTSPGHSPAPILLTPHEVAEILDRDVSELRQWRRDNVGPTFYNLGRRLIRYDSGSVEQYAHDAASQRPARP